jgi:threonylcarbamoyladenosine tRNA methylthiotransferase MtaB
LWIMPGNPRFFSLVDGHFRGEVQDSQKMEQDWFSFSLPEDTFHTRAMVKIQDGCDNFCTFCIIPFVRGRAKSRPQQDILENVQGLLAKGYKEIVLTGVNMARYLDKSSDPLGAMGADFEDLLLSILDLPGDFRLRISSLEPEGLGPKFLQAMQHPKMCPHLHLCIQSGSDKVLLQMRREYTLSEYRDLVFALRNIDPQFNITTDILYGFPGETEEDMKSTLSLVEELQFGHLHLFPYSRRKGTRADRMDQQIPEREKKKRGEALLSLGETIKKQYRQSLLGKKQKLLVETVKDGWVRGYGEHYVPIKYSLKGERPQRNSWVYVRLLSLDQEEDNTIIAEIL